MPSDSKSRLETIATIAQVVSIVVASVVSILSFNWTRQLEAAKPFLTLRQNLYSEAIHAAGVLATPDVHTDEEKVAARKRFQELYVAELSMVEPHNVEESMVEVAKQIDPGLVPLNKKQEAVYKLAHTLRDSFVESWGVKE
jgi:hypothetical protein